MSRGNTGARTHRWLDVGAALVPAAAAAYAAARLAPLGGYPALPLAAALTVAVFALAFAAMQRTDPPAAFTLPAFPLPAAEAELLLEHLWADGEPPLLDAPVIGSAPLDELMLDDPLALPADSRVVRLFDPSRFPDPGELNARIARHLARGGPAELGPADASDELRQALTELRLALRPASH